MKLITLIIAATLPLSLLANYSHESEISLVNIAGNTELETYRARTKNDYIFNEKHDLSLGGHFASSEFNGDIETAHNWDVNSRYGWIFNKLIDLQAGYQYERDKFASIDYRTNIDVGVNVKFENTDKIKTHLEIGLRRTEEMPMYYGFEEVEKVTDNKGRIFLERDQKVNKSFSYNIHIEYIPNFTTEDDFMVNSGGSINSSLTSIFYLKVGYENKYDNQPLLETLQKFDSVFSTSLLAKF